MEIEVLFTPADFAALRGRDLTQTTCVVFDVLRATSTMITALANGAAAIVPVAEIPEALEYRRKHPEVLLAGERDGLRIEAAAAGGIAFDLGNSPREFTKEKVHAKTVVMTTTNGTRALRACAGAKAVYVSCFLNLRASVEHIRAQMPSDLLLVCSGTFDHTAYEDVLAAGAFCELFYDADPLSDSAKIARHVYSLEKNDLPKAISDSRNGRRLLSRPELRDDVPFCARREAFPLVAAVGNDGRVRALA